MKFKNRLNLKSEKVLLGLFALLFVSSFATTGLLLKQNKVASNSKTQLAQVVDISNTNPTRVSQGCLTVTHKNNQANLSFLGDSETYPGNFYQLRFNFSIKNICNDTVSVIDSVSINEALSRPQLSFFTGEPIDISFTDSSYFPQDNTPYSSIAAQQSFCANCFPGPSPLSYSTSAAIANSPQILGYEIPAGQARDFSFDTSVMLYDNNNLSNIRLVIDKIRYFKRGAMNDNNLTSNEILSYVFTSEERNEYAGDFIKFNHASDYSPGLRPGPQLESVKKEEIQNKLEVKN